MFVLPIKKDGSTSISAASSETFLYTDPISLMPKWFDGKKLALKLNIIGPTGQLHVFPAISEKSGGSYITFTCASATSLVITHGTSTTGYQADGVYFIPLVNVISSGVTERLQSVPYIKFGYRGYLGTPAWTGYLCVD